MTRETRTESREAEGLQTRQRESSARQRYWTFKDVLAGQAGKPAVVPYISQDYIKGYIF